MCKYHPEGLGIPPETEGVHFTNLESHFDHILRPYATAHRMTQDEFVKKYQEGEIKEPGLDEYFLHDRAVRESGHDTTYRFDGRCANLATVDLNSLVYKYESDLADMINRYCNGAIRVRVHRGLNDTNLKSFHEWHENLLKNGVEGMIGADGGWDSIWARGISIMESTVPSQPTDVVVFDLTSDPIYFSVCIPASLFTQLANRMESLVDQYLWCPRTSLYYDFDCSTMIRSVYKTCTALWPLWAGLASKEVAAVLVPTCLEHFQVNGGLVSGTEESRGHVSVIRPSRQWDYPYGWAPHQIMAWRGLKNYGFHVEAEELAYRWLYSITKSFVEYNGVVPEKFDVVNVSHLIQVEYGNVGVDFKYVAKEGFGWMNASYQV